MKKSIREALTFCLAISTMLSVAACSKKSNDSKDSDGNQVSVSDEDVDASYTELAARTATANWTGTYLSDGYGDFSGLINAEITDKGLVQITLTVNGETKVYTMNESEYSKTGNVSSATCIADSTSETFTFNCDEEFKHQSITYTRTDATEESANQTVTFTLVNPAGHHIAPEGYVDEDRFGYMSMTYPQQEKYFTPLTDNYIINVFANENIINNGEMIPCTTTYLYSYNENDISVDEKQAYVFENNALAETAYNVLNTSDMYFIYHGDDAYYDLTLCDNVVYAAINEEHFSSHPRSTTDYEWYVDCQYWYIKDLSANRIIYTFVSQPITKEEYSVSIDEALALQNLDTYTDFKSSIAYPSKEDPNVVLKVKNNASEYYINIHGTNKDDFSTYGYWGGGLNIQAQGMNLVSLEYNNNPAGLVIYVTEADFTATEASVVVRFYKNCPVGTEVTLANYKDQTPDETRTYTFDLTQTIEE